MKDTWKVGGDGQRSNLLNAVRRMFQFNVFLLIVSVATSALLLNGVTNRFSSSTAYSRIWSERIRAFERVNQALHSASAPLDRLIATGDTKFAQERLAASRNELNQALAAIGGWAQEKNSGDMYMEKVRALLGKFESSSRQVSLNSIQAVRLESSGELLDARARVARAHEAVRSSQTIIDELVSTALDAQAKSFNNAQKNSHIARRISQAVGVLLLACVAVVIRNARKAAKKLVQVAREREELFRTLETQTAQLDAKATELRAFNRKLSESNRDLTDFAYVASHDLQEPLRKIIAFGNRLDTKCSEQLGEDGRDYLSRMQNAASRMQTLIEDLLTFSRVSTRGEAFVRTDLNVILNGVLSDLEIAIEKANATVDIGELPAIDVDPSQLRQLTQNLIGNALKFRRIDIPTYISVKATKLSEVESEPYNVSHPAANGWYRLEIRDNGIGFEQKYADKIFTVFQRLHGRTEFEGSGIGLAVCRRIIERHRGTIQAVSSIGLGATFTIVLPVSQADANAHDLGAHRHGIDDSPAIEQSAELVGA